MKLKNVKLKFTGGVDSGRGWKGDVKNMLLDMARSNPKNENPNFTARGRSNPHVRRKPNTSQRMIKKRILFSSDFGKENSTIGSVGSCHADFVFRVSGKSP